MNCNILHKAMFSINQFIERSSNRKKSATRLNSMEEWYYIGWEVKNRTKTVVKRFKCTHIKAHSTPVKGQCWQRTKHKKTILSLRASRSQKSRAPSSDGDRQTFHRHIISMKTSLDPSHRAQWLTAQTSTKGVSLRRWTKSPAGIYET